MKKAIYRITIRNWNKYNANRKKSYKCIMLSERFLDDAKIRALSPVNRLLFLSCMLAMSQSNESHCEVSHELLVSQSGVKSGSLQSQLDLLQSFQLLTYEKITVLLEKNRIEGNRIEKKRYVNPNRKKSAVPESSKSADEPPASTQPELKLHRLIEIWNEHRGPFQSVKKSNRERDRKINAVFPQNTEPEWIELVKKVAASPYCRGERNKPGKYENWRANFDWFIKPETHLKVSEGVYDDYSEKKSEESYMSKKLREEGMT